MAQPEQIQGAGAYKYLGAEDCACLQRICSNCTQRAALFADLAASGLPVEDYAEQNNRTHDVAKRVLARAFPGVAGMTQ